MPLSWNEIKSRALAFSRTWADVANEDSEAKPFWMAFFEIFGITDKRVAWRMPMFETSEVRPLWCSTKKNSLQSLKLKLVNQTSPA